MGDEVHGFQSLVLLKLYVLTSVKFIPLYFLLIHFLAGHSNLPSFCHFLVVVIVMMISYIFFLLFILCVDYMDLLNLEFMAFHSIKLESSSHSLLICFYSLFISFIASL